MCNRAILLDHGRVVLDGPTDEVLEIYSRANKDEAANIAPPPQDTEQTELGVPLASRVG
jgi:ABC-type multidrug transport system ATPase subunit